MEKTFAPSLASFGIPVVAFMFFTAGTLTAQADTDEQMIAEWKAHVLKPENITRHTDGEDITWQATPYLRGMVSMAETLDGDRECLDAFCSGFEYLMSIASKDIDGLYGWPTGKGSYGRHGPRCIIMDDAYIAGPVAHFVRLVRSDTELTQVYGNRAARYLEFVEQEIFPKWQESWIGFEEKTTTLHRVENRLVREEVVFPEPAGVYRFYLPGKTFGASLPRNQFLSVARAYLAFHDVTGRPDYLEKVKRMAVTAKYVYLVHNAARVSDQKTRYDPWCYWQPVWKGDFKSETETAHWVGPHPKRWTYHAVEVAEVAQLHKRGIVFTDEDIRRLARLNLEVMWNGDVEDPQFSYYYEPRDKTYPARLWRSLGYFDETIERLAAPRQTREAIENLAGRWRGIEGVPAYFLKRKGAR